MNDEIDDSNHQSYMVNHPINYDSDPYFINHKIDYDHDPYFNNTSPDNHHRLKHWLKLSEIGLFVFSSLNIGLIMYNYHKSLNWTTNRDSLKMADMPVDMLNDSDKQAQYKADFLVLYHKALSNNGNLTADANLMKQLKMTLAKIKTAKPIYQAKYDQVETKYEIKTSIDSLFANKNTLKSSSTPEQVRKVLKHAAPNLNSIYQKHNHDIFVKKEIKRIHKLTSDANNINAITGQMLQISIIHKGTMTPNANITPDMYNKVYHRFSKLYYNWKCFDDLGKMQNQIQQVLSEQLTKINHYNDYVKDLHNKAQAYDDLAKKRLAHREANNNAIEDERRKKLEAEQRKVEQREAEKEREAEKDHADEHQSNNQSNSSSTHHSDNSTSSSSNSNAHTSNSNSSSNAHTSSSNSSSNVHTNTHSNSSSTSQSQTSHNTNNTNQNQASNNNTGNNTGSQNTQHNHGKSNGTYVNPTNRNDDSDPANILNGD